jgi:cell division protein FtsL
LTEYYGNLALQRKRSAAPVKRSRKLQPRLLPAIIKTRRIPVTATPAPEQANRAKARTIRRSLARQRLKMLVSFVMIIFIVTGIFALIVYRQAMILEMNFQNLAVERQITKIEQECGQVKESLAQKTNLDMIRQQAIEKLGLQDPAGSQLISVIIPDTDRVIFAGANKASPDSEAYLASVFSTIEGYFKSMSRQRQGE